MQLRFTSVGTLALGENCALPTATVQPVVRAPEREIAVQAEWRLTDYCCSAGPDDAPFEEEHRGMTIAAVVGGRFRYRSDTGVTNFFPGSFLLGNTRSCYRCDHVHSTGDRCVVLSLRADYFAEIAHDVTRDSRLRFDRSLLTPSATSLRWTVALQLAADNGQQSVDEGVLADYVAWVVAQTADAAPTSAAPSPREHSRVRAICDLLATANDDAPDLSGLAAMAGVSKYHFLRLFRQETGVTPHQYRLQARLRRAAIGLAQTREPVVHVALEAGFGDLSTFNARFRRHFGMTPTAFRRAN